MHIYIPYTQSYGCYIYRLTKRDIWRKLQYFCIKNWVATAGMRGGRVNKNLFNAGKDSKKGGEERRGEERRGTTTKKMFGGQCYPQCLLGMIELYSK